MSTYECYDLLIQSIGILFSFTATICSVIAIVYTYKNLKEIRVQFFEQNRGQLVFYITRTNDDLMYSTIIKNYGNSPAKLIHLKITPDLDWNKAGTSEMGNFIISNVKNVFIPPTNHIKSFFDFRTYPDSKFDIEIKYETCGRTFTEYYSIDLDCYEYIVNLEPQMKDNTSALKHIHKSIKDLNDKFL